MAAERTRPQPTGAGPSAAGGHGAAELRHRDVARRGLRRTSPSAARPRGRARRPSAVAARRRSSCSRCSGCWSSTAAVADRAQRHRSRPTAHSVAGRADQRRARTSWPPTAPDAGTCAGTRAACRPRTSQRTPPRAGARPGPARPARRPRRRGPCPSRVPASRVVVDDAPGGGTAAAGARPGPAEARQRAVAGRRRGDLHQRPAAHQPDRDPPGRRGRSPSTTGIVSAARTS